MKQEKRKNPRVKLSPDDGLIAVFELPDKSSISGNIITLSRDGMGCMLSCQCINKIQVGIDLIMKRIIGTTHLEFLNEIKADVKWVKQIETPYLVAHLGCEFKEMKKESDQQLTRFVDMERKFRGQYD